ncbi:MAG: hypothetical protein RR326_12335 [Stenotrophomonas sp.]
MRRTIEHIVDTHKAAAELRKAGKPIWNRTINIKGILNEDRSNDSAKHVADISVRIAKLIRARLPDAFFEISAPEYDFDFVDIIENMESCTVESLASDLAIAGQEPVDMLNGWLEGIYDWADRNRVWMG